MTRLRPFVPDRESAAICLLFVAVAGFLGWNADPSFGFGPDQVTYNLFSGELLSAWDQGQPLRSERGSVYRQSFSLLHAIGQRLLGDAAASYQLILFLSACAYLPAIYLLLVHVLQDRKIAALTAVLSIVQRYTLGTSFWGMGEYQSVLPRVVVLAVFPLAWLHFERHLRSPRVLEAFLVTALGFTLHLSAVYFYCILLVTYGLHILCNRAWPSVWNLVMATVFLLFALKAVPSPMWSRVAEEAMPWAAGVTLVGFGLLLYCARRQPRRETAFVVIVYLGVAFLWLTGSAFIQSASGAGGEPASDPEHLLALNRALYARFGWTLFPISPATVGFALYNGGLLAAVAGWEFVRRWRRGATDREIVVAMYVVAVLAVSLGLTAAVQLYCRLTGRADMVLELFRAFRFIYLPLYVYLGLFLQREWRRRRGGVHVRVFLGLLIAALLVSPRQALTAMPDPVKLLVRSVAERSGSLQEGDPSQRMYLRKLLATDTETRQARARYRHLVELCEWVRGSTPEDSVFLTTDVRFLYHSGRDIMISYAQGGGSARSMAAVSGHRAWHEAYVAISSAFASRDPERILAAARRYGAHFVVAEADQAPLAAAEVYANASYRLYRMADPPDGSRSGSD